MKDGRLPRLAQELCPSRRPPPDASRKVAPAGDAQLRHACLRLAKCSLLLGAAQWASSPPRAPEATQQVARGPWATSLLASMQVKWAVVQMVSAMAQHGYLEQPGGEALIEFLVRQCALPAEQVRAWNGWSE